VKELAQKLASLGSSDCSLSWMQGNVFEIHRPPECTYCTNAISWSWSRSGLPSRSIRRRRTAGSPGAHHHEFLPLTHRSISEAPIMQTSLFFLSALVSLSMASRTLVCRADGCTADDDCADGTYCFFDAARKLITLKSLCHFSS